MTQAAMMTTHWFTVSLPNKRMHLEKLVRRSREHDPDWVTDALWLR